MRAGRFDIHWGEAIVPAIALAFGLAFFLQTTDAPAGALLWPLIIAGMLLGFWLFLVGAFVVAKHPGTPPPSPAASRTRGRIGLILGASVGYLLLISHLGFALTNFTFMLAVFRGLGGRRWGQNLAVAAGIAIFLHLALVVLMKQELPRLTIGGLTI